MFYKHSLYFQMDNVVIGGRIGTLHFIRFPTSAMNVFLQLAKSKGMAYMASTVCATGGGAFKFEANFRQVRKQVSLYNFFAKYSCCESVKWAQNAIVNFLFTVKSIALPFYMSFAFKLIFCSFNTEC